MPPLLQVEDLHAHYGLTEALHGLSFVVEEGGITTILGANGAGKTTTLRAVCGMVRTTGAIRFAGERRQHIAAILFALGLGGERGERNGRTDRTGSNNRRPDDQRPSLHASPVKLKGATGPPVATAPQCRTRGRSSPAPMAKLWRRDRP